MSAVEAPSLWNVVMAAPAPPFQHRKEYPAVPSLLHGCWTHVMSFYLTHRYQHSFQHALQVSRWTHRSLVTFNSGNGLKSGNSLSERGAHLFLECVPVFILRGRVWWVECKKTGSMGWWIQAITGFRKEDSIFFFLLIVNSLRIHRVINLKKFWFTNEDSLKTFLKCKYCSKWGIHLYLRWRKMICWDVILFIFKCMEDFKVEKNNNGRYLKV